MIGQDSGVGGRLGFLAAAAAVLLPAMAVGQAPERLGEDARMSALRLDGLTVPAAAELFAALARNGHVDWSSCYREPIPVNFTSRAQIALNLGGLVADGFVAVAAQDGQQVKNNGRDILSLAKALGVGERVIARRNTITEFAGSSGWQVLSEELEATQNDVKFAMKEQKDDDLVTLVSVGGWIRGIEVVSQLVGADYQPQNAALLRQPALAAYLRGKLAGLSPRLREDPLVRRVEAELGGLERMVSFPAGVGPGAEDVVALHAAAAALTQRISTKER